MPLQKPDSLFHVVIFVIYITIICLLCIRGTLIKDTGWFLLAVIGLSIVLLVAMKLRGSNLIETETSGELPESPDNCRQ